LSRADPSALAPRSALARLALAGLRGLGTLLLFLVAGLCFAPTLIPPFLDRVYYDGPSSAHYDGERFFNPDAGPAPGGRSRRSFFSRWAGSAERSPWPDHVPVTPTVPPRSVDGGAMRVTWIGHSTVLVQTQGLNILTDPIWSERASPFSFVGPRRVRAPGVRFEDLPPIDLVLVSHNHYDHMDLPTLRRLWDRDRPAIVTSLGNDTILRNAGISAYAYDWGGQFVRWSNGSVSSGEDSDMCGGDWFACGRRYGVIVERVHHWGSRWFTDRNRALWSGFTVRLPGGNIFFAGDTGWGDGSWVRDAARHGPFRLAIIPIGAYEPRDVMRGSHVDPEEAMAVFEGLNPVRALGVHWGTFQLTFEPIDQPWQRLAALRRAHGLVNDRFVAVRAGQGFSVPPVVGR
jgi:L-ascorbate metabolism protein UlaG (beta-lactamase superfamily)